MRKLSIALISAGLLTLAATVPAFAVGGPLGSEVDKVVTACDPQATVCDTCEGAIEKLVEETPGGKPLG